MTVTFDAKKNLVVGAIAVGGAPSPATTGTAATLKTGQGASLPAPPFNMTIAAANQQPTRANGEIVRVTAVDGDDVTIVRAQESTTARAIKAGDRVTVGPTAKTFTDIESAVNAEITRAGTAEGTLAAAVASEITRAEAAEATKASASALTTEVARAEAAEALAELLAHKDAANGYAGLDSGGKLKTAEMPGSVVSDSAGTSAPLVDGAGNQIVNVPAFQANKLYPAGFLIQQAGALVYATIAFTSGASYNAANWTAITAGFASPMSAEGDLIYQHAAVAARLPVGGIGTALASNGTDPVWSPGIVNSQSGTAYTFVAADAGAIVRSTNVAATAFTIPPNSSVNYPVPATIVAAQWGFGPLTVVPGAGVTLYYAGASYGAVGANTQYGTVVLTQVATNTWLAVRSGDPITLPSGIAGLVGWWKADAITGLSDGAVVSSWADSSVSANALTASGSNRPTYKVNIQNGLPVVRFSSNVMTASGAMAPQQVFAVAIYTFNSVNFASYAGLFTGQSAASTDLVLLGNNGTGTFFDGGLSPTPVYYKDGIIHAVASMTAPIGIAGAMSQCNISTTGFNPTLQPQVGLDRTNGGRYWLGDIAEIIAFNTVLSTANRAMVERYLQAKWGTPALSYPSI